MGRVGYPRFSGRVGYGDGWHPLSVHIPDTRIFSGTDVFWTWTLIILDFNITFAMRNFNYK